ncbi:HAMP domain-containing protein, partial [Thalassiella azotivora]
MTTQPTPEPRSRGLLTRLTSDRGVRTKILTSVGVLAVVAVVVGAIGISGLNQTSGEIREIVRVQREVVQQRDAVHQGQLKSRMLIAQVAAAASPQQKRDWAAQFAGNDAEIQAAVDTIEAADGFELMPTFEDFLATFEEFTQVRDEELLPLALANDQAGYEEVRLARAQPLIDEYLGYLDQASADLMEAAEATASEAEATTAADTRNVVVALVIGLALALGLGLLTATRIVGNLGKVKAALEAMAAGDLTARATVDSRDEVGQMADALRTAQDSVRDVVATVAGSADAVASSSQELAASSQQIAAGAEETSVQA